jgi:hypothetical protein
LKNKFENRFSFRAARRIKKVARRATSGKRKKDFPRRKVRTEMSKRVFNAPKTVRLDQTFHAWLLSEHGFAVQIFFSDLFFK